ncbi:hypothetical protein FD755_019519 [Muntiacus reevesi]|uniref:Ubiquitin-like domain-containing protein n=1 Tax=Muntiacus reevesi TaxID=9886 RepID=A0A5N3X485_MUNRE|nr:hypothetical protein FD755_019519 [Muntiacus reevesi]
MQLFVYTQELYTLQATGQESLAQIKAHVALLESVAPGDQVLLLTGTSLEDEATLGQCRYNQGFVKVAPTFGKKGPNANS